MPEFKGTPGPWKQSGLAVRAGYRNVCSNGNAARAGLNITEQVDVASANARLIAAAPELLEAIQALVARIDYYASLPDRDVVNIEDWAYTAGSDDMNAARAAIAKALGQ